jgi:hypothetical protein
MVNHVMESTIATTYADSLYRYLAILGQEADEALYRESAYVVAIVLSITWLTIYAKATKARVIQGDIFGQHRITDQVADVRMLLAPLALARKRMRRYIGNQHMLLQ